MIDTIQTTTKTLQQKFATQNNWNKNKHEQAKNSEMNDWGKPMKHLDIQKKYVWSNDDPIKTTNLRKINVSVEIQINRILNLYNKKAKKKTFSSGKVDFPLM